MSSDNSITVNGNIEGSNLIIGSDNTITILPKKEKEKSRLHFIVTLFLGLALPIFACIITSFLFAGRYYFEGIWIKGISEIISNTIVLFGVFVFSIILIIIGIFQFGAFAFKQASKVEWGKLLLFVWETLKNGIEYIKTNPNWLEAFKNFLSQDLELRERIVAIIYSLFVPGLGLVYRGRKLMGGMFFVITIIGYSAGIILGILFHLLVIVLSGLVSKPNLNFPQIKKIKDSTLRQNLSNTVKYLSNIQSVDMGLFYLGKIFETELRAYLIKSKSKNLFPIQEKDLQKLFNMIECLDRNKIEIGMDKSFLNLLRQQRNERAHGDIPNYEIQKKLTKQAPFLGNLYIDCIMNINQKKLAII